jgi:hypothetical protein
MANKLKKLFKKLHLVQFTVHSKQIINILRRTFPDPLNSKFGKTVWPARSPDEVSESFVWDYHRTKVTENCSYTTEGLKNQVTEDVGTIYDSLLQRVLENSKTFKP